MTKLLPKGWRQDVREFDAELFLDLNRATRLARQQTEKEKRELATQQAAFAKRHQKEIEQGQARNAKMSALFESAEAKSYARIINELIGYGIHAYDEQGHQRFLPQEREVIGQFRGEIVDWALGRYIEPKFETPDQQEKRRLFEQTLQPRLMKVLEEQPPGTEGLRVMRDYETADAAYREKYHQMRQSITPKPNTRDAKADKSAPLLERARLPTALSTRQTLVAAGLLASGAAVASGAPQQAFLFMEKTVANAAQNLSQMTSAISAPANEATALSQDNGVQDAVTFADMDQLQHALDVDPSQLGNAVAILNQFRYAPGQPQKVIDRWEELKSYESQWREALQQNPDNQHARAALADILAKQQQAQKPVMNDKAASLVAIKYAALITEGKLTGALKGKSPEDVFVQMMANARNESLYTPTAEAPGRGLNRARGVLQLQPVSFWETFVIHLEQYVAPENRKPFATTIKLRDDIYDQYAQKHNMALFVKNRVAARAWVAENAGRQRQSYAEASIDAQRRMGHLLVAHENIYINGEKTTVGALVDAVGAIAHADRNSPVPKGIIAKYGIYAPTYLQHQRGNAGAGQFFNDWASFRSATAVVSAKKSGVAYQKLLREQAEVYPELWVKKEIAVHDARGHVRRGVDGKPLMVKEYRTPEQALAFAQMRYQRHSMAQARENSGIWFKTVSRINKHGKAKKVQVLRSPDEVLGYITKRLFGNLPAALRTIAPTVVTPDKGRALAFAATPGQGEAYGLQVATERGRNSISIRQDEVLERAVLARPAQPRALAL